VEISLGRSQDCNRNSIPDACEVHSGQGFILTPGAEFSLPAASQASLEELTGDGHLDVLLVNGVPGTVRVLPGTGRSAFAVSIASSFPSPIQSTVTADLDGDGDLDLAAAGSFKVLLLLNDGTGKFAAGEELIAGSDPFLIVAGDLDGDALSDLATANSEGGPGFKNVSVFLNRGAARFHSSRNFAPGADAVLLAPADILGDGDVDLVFAHPGDFRMISVLESDGGGRFSTRKLVDLAAAGTPRLMIAGDLNRDGAGDLFVAAPFRKAELLLSSAGGSFLAQRLELGMDILKAVFADLDGDGQLDIAGAAGLNPVLWLFLAGQGILQLRPPGEASQELIALDAGDLDDDGDTDLAIFDRRGLRILSNEPRPAAADLDRDGVPDDCQRLFLRGDVDQNRRLELSDAVRLLSELFLGVPAGSCAKAADANDDGLLALSDAVRILFRLFLAGESLPAPAAECGPDPTPDPLPCASSGACG
jgi:hypothetical protein